MMMRINGSDKNYSMFSLHDTAFMRPMLACLITHSILYVDETAGKTTNAFYLSRLLLNLEKNKDKK